MSTQAATHLLQELSRDPDFEAVMNEAESVEARISAIVEAGKKRGYDISSSDVRAAADPADGGGELDEDQLQAVAGGADAKWYQVVVGWLTPHNWDSGDGATGVRA